jgi:hypothetical protein
VFAYYQTLQASYPIREQLIRENLEKISLSIKDEGLEKEVLVLHIRRTDYKENPSIGLLPADYFNRALNQLSKKYEWDELWLFSDDFQEAILMVPDEFKSKVKVVSDGTESPTQTLALMACGNSFILSNSSFGWWAANLAYLPPKYVVVPNEWFKKIPEPVGLIPNHWIRVKA